jgi:hypothetical protein
MGSTRPARTAARASLIGHCVARRAGLGCLLTLATAHCAGPDEESRDEELLEEHDHDHMTGSHMSALAQWTHCANHGQTCTFSGTKQVRYGANGVYTTATFTNGVRCSGRAFGIRSSRSFHCEFDAADPMAMPMGNMPYVDESAIPTGDPGVSVVQIKPTTDQPAPTADGTGDFRNVCKFSHMNFDDPIVFPGRERATHLHAYFGNTLADGMSTAESLRTTGNSTCRAGTANRTAYWVPAVLDAKGVPQKPADSHFYYKTGYGGIAPSAIKAFPAGLRILAGDPKATAAQPHAYWSCHEFYLPRSASIANCGVGNHAVMSVEFPQCWNGRDLDSTDHRSHMAYPENGACPSTHPVAIPAISFNVLYPIPSTGTAGWRLASDMYDPSLPGGLSAHGDWFDGWDPDVAEAFVKNCDNKAVDCHSHLLGDGREIY